jgi:hypothetical protein
MGIFIKDAVVFVEPTGPTINDWNFSERRYGVTLATGV